MSSARIKLCVTGEVPPGEARKVETHDLALAVFNVDGSFHVTDDACTHGPGSLSEGYLDGEVIECNFHQGCFNVRTGAVVSPPVRRPDQNLHLRRRGRHSVHRAAAASSFEPRSIVVPHLSEQGRGPQILPARALFDLVQHVRLADLRRHVLAAGVLFRIRR